MQFLNGRFGLAIRTSTATLGLLLSACSETPPAHDASSNSVAYVPDAAAGTGPDKATTVQVSKAFRQRCSLPEDTQSAPVFEFDQSALHASGRNVLDDVAVCLVDGPLKGEVITVVGRADARGNAGHNEDLGATRAAAARNYLVKRGVPSERVHLMSRGEQGARGTDEASFKLDRRVDLELGDLANSPILEGTMLHAESAPAPSKTKAGNYADTADGPVGGSVTGAGSSAAAGK